MSIFKLKQRPEELKSSNMGITQSVIRQVAPSRDCTGNNFSNGTQYYKWDLSGNRWFVPSRSYFRIRASLTKADGTTPLILSDNIAPNQHTASHLWQSAEFRIGSTPVCRIDNRVAQCDALKSRLNKSRSWLKSVGESTNFSEEDFKLRQAQVCSDGNIINEYVQSGKYQQTSNEIGFSASATVQENKTNSNIVFDNSTGNSIAGAFEVGDVIDIQGGQDFIVTSVQLSSADKIATVGVLPSPVADEATGTVKAFNRKRPVDSGAEPSRRVKDFELVYQPSLGIFDYEGALPCGSYEMVMQPLSKSLLEQSVIESVGGNKVHGTDYKFEIKDIYFYICELEGPRCDSMTYLLDMEQIRLTTNKISSSSFGQRQFDVSPSTRAIAVAFQDGRAGSGTDTRISSSKFRSYDGANIDPQDDSKDTGLSLNRMYYSYAGTNYPNTSDVSPEFDENSNTDLTTQRYVDTLIQSGGLYDTGGSEKLSEWQRAGAYYYNKIYRDATDTSTRLNLYTQFSRQIDTDNSRALVFDIHSNVARVTVHNGMVMNVELSEA